jgi:hypothetical protein
MKAQHHYIRLFFATPCPRKTASAGPLTITAFDTNEWLGVFWSDQADQLIGFVLVKRRTPQQGQEGLDWFVRNMT